MKTTHYLKLTALVSVLMLSGAQAQEKQEYRIFLNIDKNGEQVTIDTSFSSKAAMEEFMKQHGHEMPPVPPTPGTPPTPPTPPTPYTPITPPTPPTPPTPRTPGDVSGLREVEEFIIRDDIKFSKMQKEQIRKELKHARKEMGKARIELEKAGKEFEHLRNLRIEIDESFENGELSRIHIIDGNEINMDTLVERIVIINSFEDGEAGSEKIRTLKFNCDSLIGEGDKVVIIRSGGMKEKMKYKAAEKINKEELKQQVEAEIEEAAQLKELDEASKPATNNERDYQLDASDFSLYPNPTQGKITVSFNVASPGPVDIRLLDAAGRVVIEEQVQIEDGHFSREYSIEGKSRGTYLLQLRQGDKWRHEKVILK